MIFFLTKLEFWKHGFPFPGAPLRMFNFILKTMMRFDELLTHLHLTYLQYNTFCIQIFKILLATP